MSTENILENAIKVKLQADENILLGDKLYICMECGAVTDWWKPGGVCYNCEAEGERQFEEQHDEN